MIAENWEQMLENAECFQLEMSDFKGLAPFYNALDRTFFRECASSDLNSFPKERVLEQYPEGRGFEEFLLLCAVAAYGRLEELYRRNNWPEFMRRQISGDLAVWQKIMKRDLGHPGLTWRIFLWVQACLNGEVKQCGRLQFNDIHLFDAKYSVYRNRDGSLKVLPVNRPGNPPSPALSFMDKALNIHIPAIGPLKREECLESLKGMMQFSEKYHPDYDYKAVVCYSWLLDPNFRRFMKPDSNILRFQELGHVFPWHGRCMDGEIRWRLWGTPFQETPLDRLPADTSMQRGVLDFWKQGGSFCEGILVIFKDELSSLLQNIGGTAKSNDAGFRQDLEKDGIWNFEAATLCGNSRKNPSSGLSRADERQVETFGSAANIQNNN